jgi:predicted HTH transcriptional regulator
MTEFQGQFVIDFSPATRKTHPKTSSIAEKEITKSGRRIKHSQIILQALKYHNGSTSAELAHFLPLTKEQVHKRMADLEHNGHIQKGRKKICDIKNSWCVTWWLI